MGLRGTVRNRIIGVYELPDGNTTMLSDGYLESGSKVEVIRYCENPINRGEYWALIFYSSAERNTGWVRVRLPGSPDFVSLSAANQPVAEVLEENPQLRMDCPTRAYVRMPGDEFTPTPSATPENSSH